MKKIFKLLSVVVIALLIFVSCTLKQETKNTMPFFIGTYTSQGAEGIYLSSLDTITGDISSPQLVAKVTNPSYLTLSHNKEFLFVVSENGGSSEGLYVFKNETNGSPLELIDSMMTNGADACYISELPGRYLVIAHYSSGDVVFVPFEPDGRLNKAKMVQFVHDGSGPNLNRQEQPHAHSALADISGDFVYVADLGADIVAVYQVKESEVKFIRNIEVAPGAGPRHLSFHPSGKIMALLNELNSTINIYGLDSEGVFSELLKTIDLLPDSLIDGSLSADIHFSKDGKALYASVRGVDRLYTLLLNDEADCTIAYHEEEIQWPRNFVIDPTEKFLLVANQHGNDIVVFERRESGELMLLNNKVELSQPVCLKF